MSDQEVKDRESLLQFLRRLFRRGPKQGNVRNHATLESWVEAVKSKTPSLPWTWTGGYPQRITGPDATLIAEVFESPDAPAVIAPLICNAVNAYFGVEEGLTYDIRA